MFTTQSKRQRVNQATAVSTTGGFTLIEMLVALVIFSMVMLVAIGSLVSIIEANRKARNEKVIVNNINAAVENMSRQIREGSDYKILGESSFSFISQDGNTVLYSLSTENQLIRSKDGGLSYLPITSPAVVLDTLDFAFVSSGGASEQPKVLITMSGNAGGQTRTRSYFNLQTTVSQRYAPSSQEAYTSDTVPIPVCPYTQTGGRSIINFSELKIPGKSILCSDKSYWPAGCNEKLDYDLQPKDHIPPGKYDIGLVPWDDHCDATGSCAKGVAHSGQFHEKIYMELYDSAGVLLFRTLPTGIDIPDDKNLILPPEVVAQDVQLNNTATRIVVGHALVHPTNSPGTGNVNSVVPACAMFETFAASNIDIQPF